MPASARDRRNISFHTSDEVVRITIPIRLFENCEAHRVLEEREVPETLGSLPGAWTDAGWRKGFNGGGLEVRSLERTCARSKNSIGADVAARTQKRSQLSGVLVKSGTKLTGKNRGKQIAEVE